MLILAKGNSAKTDLAFFFYFTTSIGHFPKGSKGQSTKGGGGTTMFCTMYECSLLYHFVILVLDKDNFK